MRLSASTPRPLLAPLLALAALLLAPAPATAAFGLNGIELSFTGAAERQPGQAGAHPGEVRTAFGVNLEGAPGELRVQGALRDLVIELPDGFAGNPTAMPTCATADFLTKGGEPALPQCPDSTAVGTTRITTIDSGEESVSGLAAVFNLDPPPGAVAKLGFWAAEVPVTIEVGLTHSPPYRPVATLRNVSQVLEVSASETVLWGNPADPANDPRRGRCAELGGSCPAGVPVRPFITSPRTCEPLSADFRATAWWEGAHLGPSPGGAFEGAAGVRMLGCASLPFSPSLSVRPTTDHADSPSGLEASLSVADEGLGSPAGLAHSDIKKIEVTLPEGVTINPSQAEGLHTCSRADLAREAPGSAPGEGCPQASKVGAVAVTTPLLEGELLRGAVFVATPYDNLAGDALIALYVVIKSPELGIVVTQAGRVEPDPRSGRLRATFDDLPKFPLGEVELRLREGGRSPLVTPRACGPYETLAVLTPWARPGDSHADASSFRIARGPGGAACPPAGAPPFEPGLEAGSLDNRAAAHTPFLMRLTRRDGDQDLVRFDATLPPGVSARLAGVPWCPDAAIARARGRDGKDELRDPSCPAASRIGTVQGGAGAGSQLTYVPGGVYLAGPTGGAPISVVGIVPAVAGPFDVGTIVVRQALDLDPISGVAKVLSSASDPLPHILAGIPLRVRDIQVSVDRPDFTLNPTSCEPTATLAGIWGGGSDAFSAADDFPALRSARFQAAGCRGLGFAPRLGIKLKGGVRRGAHPALRAHVRPRPGDANFSRAVVTLPRSAFLEQAHIRTICTRVRFAAGAGHGSACPKGARYGYARAWSPLIDGPVQGPVFLRSSDNKLPDLVAALTGPPTAAVEVELSARIDSVKGGIRSTFAAIPDLPVSRFILDMQGGKKGLIVNSRHLCHEPKRNRARANLRGQNGRLSRTRPRVIAAACAKRRKARRARAGRSAGHLSRASRAG